MTMTWQEPWWAPAPAAVPPVWRGWQESFEPRNGDIGNEEGTSCQQLIHHIVPLIWILDYIIQFPPVSIIWHLED